VCIPLLTLFVVTVGILFPHRFAMKRFRRAISWYGKVIIHILPFPFIKISYMDYENDGYNGPYIFVCNHVSASDAFLMAVLPYECIQVVNTWPFRVPVLGCIAKMAGYLNVREMEFNEFMTALAIEVVLATCPHHSWATAL
jgi:1-acyl-sn-glycerol-3-phosphate acyltransferase